MQFNNAILFYLFTFYIYSIELFFIYISSSVLLINIYFGLTFIIFYYISNIPGIPYSYIFTDNSNFESLLYSISFYFSPYFNENSISFLLYDIFLIIISLLCFTKYISPSILFIFSF